jgi:hypothetical protein
MKIWFIRRNNENLGPYTLEDLKNLGLKKEDFIWKEGMPEWMQARTQPELNEIFTQAMPPLFSTTTNGPEQSYDGGVRNYRNKMPVNKKRSSLRWILPVLLVIGIVGFLIYQNNRSQNFVLPFNSGKSAEELKADLATTESQNPGEYLKGQVRIRRNLLGEVVVEGTLSNNATLAVYKDIVLQIDYLSKTGTVLLSKDHTVYEVIQPNGFANFKFKFFGSKDIKEVSARILGAKSN